MSSTIATREAVFAAADAMHAQGIEPTGRKVIAFLGGGSLETIQPLLAEWRTYRDALAAVVVPVEILSRGTTLVRELYAHAFLAAQATFTDPLRRALDSLESAEGQVAAAKTELVQLEKVGRGQAEKIDILEKHSRELELSLAGLQATAEGKTQTIERLEAQLERSQRDLADRTSDLAEARASSNVAETLETIHRSLKGLAAGKAG